MANPGLPVFESRGPHHRCLRCNYDLGGMPPEADGLVTCPECGQRGAPLLRPLDRVYTLGSAMWASCWPAMVACVVLVGHAWLVVATSPGVASSVLSLPCALMPLVMVTACGWPPYLVATHLAEQWRRGYRPSPRAGWTLLAALGCNAAMGMGAGWVAAVVVARLEP